jgi:hypothetical protein
MRIESSRAATGTLTVGAQVASASASMLFTQGAETAPKETEGGTQPLPGDGGEYPPPPPGDGEYPPPPADGGYLVPSETRVDTGSVEGDAAN